MKHLISLFCLLLTFSALSARTFDIREYGAVSDTTALSTTAIQHAIEDCSRAGGGRVVIHAGDFKTGSLMLRSGVNLYLEEGATLYGSTDISDYTPMTSTNVSLRTGIPTIQLIYADSVENVSITGHGTIDGRGKAFPKLSWNDEGITRPHLLRIIRGKDVEVSGITLKNSGCWMQHYLACDRLRIDEAGPTGSSITGLSGHPVKDILLQNITIRHAGGQPLTPAPTDEKTKEYPESTMWGILPAQGFWLNHAEDITLRNITVESAAPDSRPVYVTDDCRNITIE